jgi:TldD protein
MLKTIRQEIGRLKRAGADYVDVRWYPFEDANYLMMWNGNLKQAISSRESGIGIRVLYKGAWGFSAASDVSHEGALFDKALDNARAAAQRVAIPVRLSEKEAITAYFESPCRVNPLEVPLADKVAFLNAMDEKLNQTGVEQRIGSLKTMRKQVVFVDSEGSQI